MSGRSDQVDVDAVQRRRCPNLGVVGALLDLGPHLPEQRRRSRGRPAASPSPARRPVTRPPTMAAAAKKYDADDASGSMAYGGHGRVAAAGDVEPAGRRLRRRRRRTTRITAAVSSTYGRDTSVVVDPDGAARRGSRAPPASDPETNWLDTDARRPRPREPVDAAVHHHGEVAGRAPVVDLDPQGRGGRPARAPSDGSAAVRRRRARYGPGPRPSTGSRNRAVVPDRRTSRSSGPSGSCPAEPDHLDRRCPHRSRRRRRRPRGAGGRRSWPRCRRRRARRSSQLVPSASAAHTSARLVRLFEPGTATVASSGPSTGSMGSRIRAVGHRHSTGRSEGR